MQRCVLVLFLLLASGAAGARTFIAEVTHVTDGDTVWVKRGHDAPKQLRLRGIDAPEICQAFGREAQAALAWRVLHKQVAVTTAGRDDYQRWLATLRIGGEDIGGWLVAEGYAWAHRWRRRPAGAYATLEAGAREARRGLWSERWPLEPRRFRQQHGSCH